MAGDPACAAAERQRHADKPAAEDDEIAAIGLSGGQRSRLASAGVARPGVEIEAAPVESVGAEPGSRSTAARVGAMSTVSTGAGCSNPAMPLRQNRIGTRRS